MTKERKKKRSALRQLGEEMQQVTESIYQQNKTKYLRWEKILIAIPTFHFFFSGWQQIVAADHISLPLTISGFATAVCLAWSIRMAQKLRVDWSWERFYIPVIFAAAGLFLGSIAGETLREYELKKPRLTVGTLHHSDGMTEITSRGPKAYVYMKYVAFKIDAKDYVELCTRCSSLAQEKSIILRVGRHFTQIVAEDEEGTKKRHQGNKDE